MRSRTLSLVALAAATAACGSPPPATPSPSRVDAVDAAAAKGPWAPAMQELGQLRQTLQHTLLDTATGDLQLAADSAAAAAAIVREGYGRCERRDVPQFARFAREAESWLLQIGLEARQGHAELARELLRDGDRQHCQRCHDAAQVHL